MENDLFPTTNSYLRLPLPEGLKILITRECDKLDVSSAEVISQISSALTESNIPQALSINLMPLLKENTHKFITKLMMYRKKACRDGRMCKRGNLCIFSHESYKRPPTTNMGVDDTEVIFNRVPIDLCDIQGVRDYAMQYGLVSDVKALKDNKFLIKYSSHEEARSLINSKEPVMGDFSIKKFFNKARTEDLDDLFDQHEDVLRKLGDTNVDKGLVKRLGWIIGRIKMMVGTEDKVKRFKKDSLLCNSNFVME